jgi:hypothetical protein
MKSLVILVSAYDPRDAAKLEPDRPSRVVEFELGFK